MLEHLATTCVLLQLLWVLIIPLREKREFSLICHTDAEMHCLRKQGNFLKHGCSDEL